MKKRKYLPKICNTNYAIKYYKNMKNNEKFFWSPKRCSNYTSLFDEDEKMKKCLMVTVFGKVYNLFSGKK